MGGVNKDFFLPVELNENSESFKIGNERISYDFVIEKNKVIANEKVVTYDQQEILDKIKTKYSKQFKIFEKFVLGKANVDDSFGNVSTIEDAIKTYQLLSETYPNSIKILNKFIEFNEIEKTLDILKLGKLSKNCIFNDFRSIKYNKLFSEVNIEVNNILEKYKSLF
jgi:hypothetical protein